MLIKIVLANVMFIGILGANDMLAGQVLDDCHVVRCERRINVRSLISSFLQSAPEVNAWGYEAPGRICESGNRALNDGRMLRFLSLAWVSATADYHQHLLHGA